MGGLAATWDSRELAAQGNGFQYEDIRWIDERQDPSITLETEELVAKVIDNTGLRLRPDALWKEPTFSHHIGFHGVRALWRKDEKRNIVAPLASWLNLQGLRVEGLKLDPIDSRARFGVGRGWPVAMKKDGGGVLLKIGPMPQCGIEYAMRLKPGGADALDFEVSFTLHKKGPAKAAFQASWPCYMSTYDEVQLFAPTGDPAKPEWQGFGEKEDYVIGDPVNYVHTQRRFTPGSKVAFPAAYGRVGARVLAIFVSRPEVQFFLVNNGGHRFFLPVQNPAWDFLFQLPDYEPGKPFGFHGRVIYKNWQGADEIAGRYREWQKRLPGA